MFEKPIAGPLRPPRRPLARRYLGRLLGGAGYGRDLVIHRLRRHRLQHRALRGRLGCGDRKGLGEVQQEL